MTNEELQRVRRYAAKIQAADGNLSALTDDESLDLEALIRERLDKGKEMIENKEVMSM